MATLPRPRVEIEQRISATAPTVLQPALNPCIIGPCFQIVEPLDADGALNPDAKVSTAALLRSSLAVGDPSPLSGLKMKIAVDGAPGQVINFPITISGAPISHALIENTINTQLTGASAIFQDAKLVISSASRGASARLKLEAIVDDAYAVLNMVAGTEVTGKQTYDNQDFELPFNSMPSPLAAVADLQIDADAVILYRYFGNVLRPFSKDSAPNITSRTGVPTEFADAGNAGATRIFRPALGSDRTTLIGRKIPGSKTDVMIHPGKEASITIPLAHDVTGSGTVRWPDVSGLNWLKVTAIGLQNFLADQEAGVPGNFIGLDGNEVSVIFTLNGAVPLNEARAIWNSGAKTLEIQRRTDDIADLPSFTALANALDDIAGIDPLKDVIVELNFSSDVEALPYLPDITIAPATGLQAPWFLGGGEDPADFSADQVYFDIAGAPVLRAGAGLTGATQVLAADTPAGLGIVGEKIVFSIDGQESVEFTFAAGAVEVDDQLATVPGLQAKVTSLVSPDDTNGNVAVGQAISVLQLVADGGANGPDSTLEMSIANDRVRDILFGGFKSKVEAAVTGFGMGGAGWLAAFRRGILTGVTDYNKLAVTGREIALTPGALDLNFQNVTLPGFILMDVDLPSIFGLGAAAGFVLEHSTVGSFAMAVDFTVVGPPATLASTVAAINLEIVAAGHDALISAASIGDRIVIFERTGLGGAFVRMVEAGTDAGLVLALGGSDMFDETGTTVATNSVRLQDKGTNFAMRVVSVGNGLSHAVLPASGSFDASSEADLSALCLSSLATENTVDYSTGLATVTFQGDSEEAVAADKLGVIVRLKGDGIADVTTSTVDMGYSRVWACATQPNSPAYVGRIFMGGALKAKPGDMLWNNGSTLGRVVALNDFAIGTKTFPGAEVSISETALDAGQTLSSWYIIAHALPDTDRLGLAVEMEVDSLGERITVKGAMNRDGAGLPVSGPAPLYVGYKALRRDVSANTTSPELLVFNTADEVEALIGPVIPDNPLAFALSKAFLNRSTISISALGIDEVTPDAPNGTIDAYATALEFLGKKEVYALAPLVQNPGVAQLFNQHVTDFSAAEQGRERIAFVNEKLPTEKVATLVISGIMTISDIGGGKFELQFTDNTLNISTALDGAVNANGDTISGALGTVYSPDDGIFIDREGDAFRWLVTKLVDANTVEINTTDVYQPGFGPGSGGNDDAYFQTNAAILADFEADGEVTSVQVRQAAVTTDTAGARLEVASVMAEITGGPGGYNNRRLFWLQPESVGTDSGGTEVLVPGFYLCAAEAARVGQFPAQQGHTNFPLVGFTRPVGSSELFSETEMATAAAGGVWWTIQDAQGAPLIPRHQLSTDITSVKTQELSITKAVDLYAKAIRSQIRAKIGRNNIDKSFLEALAITLQGVSSRFAGQNKTLAAATITTIAQNPDRIDGVIAVAEVITWIPVNNIRVVIAS